MDPLCTRRYSGIRADNRTAATDHTRTNGDPLRRRADVIRRYQLLVALAIIAALWLCWQIRFVLAILLAGYIIAASILPAIDAIERKHIPRIGAILVVVICFIALVALAAYFFASPLQSAWQSIDHGMFPPSSGMTTTLQKFGVDLSSILGWVRSNILAATSATASSAAGVLSAIIVGLYVSYDWYHIREWLSTSRAHEQLYKRIIDAQGADLGAWMRGQLVLSAIVGAGVYVSLSIAGVPFAPSLALAAALLELVPYAGPVIAAIPAALIAFQSSVQLGLIVVAIYTVIQQCENHLLVPLVMRRAVYIHPVIVIAAILAGFSLMGIAGALLAVPFTSLVWTTFKTIRAKNSAH